MKTISLKLFLLLFLLTYPHSLPGQPHPFPEEDKAAIKTLIQKTEDYNNAGDVKQWVALFAANAVYMPPGSPAVTTREDLIETAKAGFKHQASISIEPVEIKGSGDWAFARTQVKGTININRSNEIISLDLKQIVIYKREPNGQWKIARLISNSNTP